MYTMIEEGWKAYYRQYRQKPENKKKASILSSSSFSRLYGISKIQIKGC
ncbi:hypothetical protein M2369_000890 [Bacillus sp. JUb11]|nr:hypothetical protein [Bacillus sp. JUb11]MCS3483402.1 hypothetical protein [Bacillus sp. JUb11]